MTDDPSSQAGGPGPPPPPPPPSAAPPPAEPGSGGPHSSASQRPPLLRRDGDRVLGGVCAAIARHLGIDATLVRVVVVVLTLAGGAGLLGYAAGYLLIPAADADGTTRRPGRITTLAGIAVLAVAGLVLLPGPGFMAWGLGGLLLLALAAAGLWWAARSRPAQPGEPADIARRLVLGIALLTGCAAVAGASFLLAALGARAPLAVAVIAAGLVIVVASLARRPIPAATPVALSLALPLGVVAAADLDISGGAGERFHRPAALEEIRAEYRLGAGKLQLDLRDVDFDGATRRVRLSLGAGSVRVLVPGDVCVSGRTRVGAGATRVLDRHAAGLDVDWTQDRRPRPGAGMLMIDAEIGLGELAVSDRIEVFDGFDGFDGFHHGDDVDRGPFPGPRPGAWSSPAGCER